MGGDHGPVVTLPACRAFLAAHPEAELILVGRPDALAQALAWPRCTIVGATEVVEMTDSIEVALRRKKDSSLRLAVTQVKPGSDGGSPAQACVSAGNTGALMAVSRYVLKTTPGIDRPAIAYGMPNQRDGFTTVLDLGANIDCGAEHLLQFAVMGSALVGAIDGKAEPTVGLLNIGEEAMKGGEAIKQAGELLRAAAAAGLVNFHGNVEGNDVFKGTTDIVVCDGFVGNVLLKASEGLASMLTTFIKQEFKRTALTRLAALAALPVLNRFKARVDPRRYNGAALLGLRGLVFKSHGSADAFAFEQALNRAYDAARNGLLDRVHTRIVATLAAMPAAARGGEPTAFDTALSEAP
ncbi:MAG: phosphate acyltransferase PlsX [Pseudomonadota bacterium]|nr:phosphate acyltransferase PlsX [Pseudomonadota bacterium]